MGSDWLKPTGISGLPDPVIGSWMGTWPYAGIQTLPPAHGAWGFETAKAIFATTRGITL